MCISFVRQIPSDKLTSIFDFQILKKVFIADVVFNTNKIRIAEFIQETVFVPRKPCAEIES